jgi:hypothetical protein
MAKTRTAGRDLLLEVHEVMAERGWDFCPSCHGIMVSTMLDVRSIPEDLVNERHVALAEASHKDPAGDLVGLECGACNRERGRRVWDAPATVVFIPLRGSALWSAYRRAHARRAAYAARRQQR